MIPIPYSTLCEAFLQQTTGPLRDKTYLQYKPQRGAAYHSISFAEFGSRVHDLVTGLLQLGITRGDRVALLSESRPEWLLVDHACLLLGAITVPMFPTLTQKQVEYVLQDSGARIAFVSNDLQLGKAVKSLEACPTLETVIVFNASTTLATTPRVRSFLSLTSEAKNGVALESLAARAQTGDVITIIYTSGTTGVPKGVMLTHGNLLSNIYGALAVLPKVDENDVALSFLPLCHAFERVAMYLFFVTGFTVAFAESSETVAENLVEIRPTVLTGVPRLYERIFGRIMRMRDKMTPNKRKIFDWSIEVGKKNGVSWEGRSPSIAGRALLPIASKLVLAKIRERTGGRIRFFVSGAAALSAEVGRAFAAFGLPIIEGYGMTEASPIISVSPFTKLKWGSVGKPLPNIEVRIAEDGEILTRGPHVMKGYYNDAEATRMIIDSDGWLHTGDIGEFDSEGYLKITDRKKHLFVSTGGKNIAPAHVEGILSQSRYIDQIMLIGDKRQYVTAIIVPDFDTLRDRARDAGAPVVSDAELVADPETERLITEELERLQKDVASYERVRKFALLADPFSIDNGMLTPTLKVKRKEVEKRYAELIDSLYAARTIESV